MSKEFIPKTRLQMYKAAIFGDIENIPDKYFIEETTAIIDNKELSFSADGNNYAASLCNSSIVLDSQDVVKIDNVVVPLFDASATYQTGDLYWRIDHNHNQMGKYAGTSVISVGASPSGTKHASVYRTTRKCTLLPKTPIETYFANRSGLFNQGDFEILEPKTTNEKLTVLECGGSGEFDISPKTRSQWYRAKALELVEAVPESKLPPKTNIEKYYAYKAGLYDGELPEPKTADEYYVALDCGWEPEE